MGIKDEFKKIKKKFSIKQTIVFVILVFAIVLVFASFYKVDATEQAVITRFGKYIKTVSPGLHMKIPFGIEKNYNVPVKVVQTEQFGFSTQKSSRNDNYNYSKESTMLTGDLNIVDVEWIIQYKITNPSDWLFKVNDKRQTIRDISQSVINTLVGDRAILDVMGIERSSIQNQAQIKMNEYFEQLGLGINVIAVQLQNVVPPRGVQDAFEDVNMASQDMERYINEGKEAYNAQIPLSQGIADQQIQIAEGYAIDRVNRAKGDVARFNAIYSEYQKAPSVTRERLYLEMMEEIFKNTKNAVIIDKELQNMLPIKNITSPSNNHGNGDNQ
ncbi:MAG: FtsH protease activity modulator HflK [Treponemataceae bacterium]|nr:FtsH protease activity modulator HflK [Treponemataceae bacterium]